MVLASVVAMVLKSEFGTTGFKIIAQQSIAERVLSSFVQLEVVFINFVVMHRYLLRLAFDFVGLQVTEHV